MQNGKQEWISEMNEHLSQHYQLIKSNFIKNLQKNSVNNQISYYDFLLIAKKMNFRFEQPKDLIHLKHYFNRHHNLIQIHLLFNSLCVLKDRQLIHQNNDKIIVKFKLPQHDFAIIHQAVNQDQDNYVIQEVASIKQQKKNQSQKDQQISDKITIILSIKIQEMMKKIKYILDQCNIFSIFSEEMRNIQYQQFRKGLLKIIIPSYNKIKISEEDIRALFYILDKQNLGAIQIQDLELLKDQQAITLRMKQYYSVRINKDMVKRTLFKLGKNKGDEIQIFQAKNTSVLDFQKIQQSIIKSPKDKLKQLKQIRFPAFGPLKQIKPLKRLNNIKKNQIVSNKSATLTSSPNMASQIQNIRLRQERYKIEKILRLSKEKTVRQKKVQTISSKLRSLFIHKVILPREKMLQQENQRYRRVKSSENPFNIKVMK